ncbi:hypothetical protein [Devosia alba]
MSAALPQWQSRSWEIVHGLYQPFRLFAVMLLGIMVVPGMA